MGEVWLAYDPSLKINVAIKTLPDFLVRKDPSMVTRFEQEARLAARIDHRNICRVYDVGQHDDIHYIVMEYIKGGSVGDMLRERGEPLSVFESLSIIKGVTVGLCAAENASIVHRDIKPDNILIDEGGVPKLADLGLAKSLADGAELTMTGASMGTAAYIAPEQAQDSKRADTRSDIYSLGATLYHMITGKVPFHGDTPFSVMMKHVRDPVPDPSEYNPDVTREVTNLVWKMMEKNPDKRYPSARSLHLAVDETERRYQASSVRRKKSVSRQRKKAVSRQPDLDPRPKKRRRKEPVAPAPKKPEAAADEVPAVSDPVQAPDEANASERGEERKVTKDPGNAKNANDSSSSKRRGKHPKGRPRPAVGDDVLGDSGKPIRIVASVLGTVVGAVLGISLFMQMTSSPPLEPDPIPERPVATPPI
jgi:serine/threonine protein kinase